MTLARKAGLKAVPTGIEHGTVTVIAGGKVTTIRIGLSGYAAHAGQARAAAAAEPARRKSRRLSR